MAESGESEMESWSREQLIEKLRQLDPTGATSTDSALRERELRFRSVFETAVEGIITMGEDCLIESMNPAALRMFGYEEGELVGANVKVLMPSPHRQHHDEYVSDYTRTGHARIIGIGREVSGLRKDGTIFPMALSVSEAQLPTKRLFTGVIRDLTERRTLEQQILQAADEERHRIAQDLHDGIGSHLSGVALLCDALGAELERRELPQAVEAREILSLVNEGLDQLRGVARGLHPVESTKDGLMRSLDDLATQNRKAWKVSCDFDCPDAVFLGNPAAANHLFRIAQEAVTNAVKHGRASQISIRLSREGADVTLEVRDDGVGFDQERSPESRGLGLRTMAYRAGLFGGDLSIAHVEPTGTRVTCTMPV